MCHYYIIYTNYTVVEIHCYNASVAHENGDRGRPERARRPRAQLVLAARESEDEEGKGLSAETRERLYINIELYIDTHEINYIDKIR